MLIIVLLATRNALSPVGTGYILTRSSSGFYSAGTVVSHKLAGRMVSA